MDLGKYDVIFNRVYSHLAKINTLVIWYVGYKSGLHPLVLLLLLLCVPLLALLDNKKVYPESMQYSWRKNPEYQYLLKTVHEIKINQEMMQDEKRDLQEIGKGY